MQKNIHSTKQLKKYKKEFQFIEITTTLIY